MGRATASRVSGSRTGESEAARARRTGDVARRCRRARDLPGDRTHPARITRHLHHHDDPSRFGRARRRAAAEKARRPPPAPRRAAARDGGRSPARPRDPRPVARDRLVPHAHRRAPGSDGGLLGLGKGRGPPQRRMGALQSPGSDRRHLPSPQRQAGALSRARRQCRPWRWTDLSRAAIATVGNRGWPASRDRAGRDDSIALRTARDRAANVGGLHERNARVVAPSRRAAPRRMARVHGTTVERRLLGLPARRRGPGLSGLLSRLDAASGAGGDQHRKPSRAQSSRLGTRGVAGHPVAIRVDANPAAPGILARTRGSPRARIRARRHRTASDDVSGVAALSDR